MRYSGLFAPVLIAGVAVASSALAEGRLTFHAIELTPSNRPPQGAPPCTATFCKSIPARYDNTGLLGITEFETNYPTCTYIDHGQWSAGADIEPRDHGTPAGTVDVSEAPFTGPTPPGCDGTGGPYLYDPIYFKWTLRKNLTAVPGYGPTASFNSNWKTSDGIYDEPYSFQITVPVVRPIGETIKFAGLEGPHGSFGNFGAYGAWLMTLKPPADDGDFDFTGESIREKYENVQNTCSSRAPGVLGSQAVTPNGVEATWTVGQLKGAGGVVAAGKNVWGYDYTGFDACTIFAYRCAGVTQPPCGITLRQGITIKSPADQDFTAPLYYNQLGEGIGGVSYPATSIKYGDGPITVKRMNASSGGERPFDYVSTELACLSRPAVLSILKSRKGSCSNAPGPTAIPAAPDQ